MLLRPRLKAGFNSILPVLCRGKKTHFGFVTVDEEEKQQRVYDVFRNVATKYDLMNDAMSFGLHRLWKDAFVRELRPKPYMRILDAAGGTGDIALRISSESRKIDPSRPCEVVVTDINRSMLNVGRQKAEQSKATGLSWLRADAEELPFNDNTFDAYTIAFGIRNCTHIEKVLDEALRVLVPGGRPYDWYSFNVIPVLGRLIANDWTSYRYLVESIRTFPDQQSFAKLMRQSGFESVTWTNMLCGIVAIHSGYKVSTTDGARQCAPSR
ncbi:hypothetical protein M513_01401 [Trichuris suis]|uniref:2-methoxy-6-polyprenyl-1,4-benzoquinol methylase, mitochondrial n=1 Tax=Trichuris suis TaxID=68888 RepID=A0A085MKI5_9BILA|nr:hypothetical protein M513_01401 [Trichuris suis]